MLTVFLMLILVGCGTMQNVFRKPFANRFNGKGTHIFNAFTTGTAAIFFAVISGGLKFETAILPYVLALSVCYATSTITFMLALSCGPLSLSSLILSFSAIIPTCYGIILGEPIKYFSFLPGLILLFVSLVLTNKPEKNQKFSLKWLALILTSSICSGLCAVFQTAQQVAFKEQFGNELMFCTLLIVTVVFLIFSIITERKELKLYLKSGAYLGVLTGVCNGGLNLMQLLLRPLMGAALLFPIYSGGTLILTFFISTFFYKEKLSKIQILGFVLGLGSVILLSM